MIQPMTLTPTAATKSDRSMINQTGSIPGAFKDIFQQLKPENDQQTPNDLLALVDSMLEKLQDQLEQSNDLEQPNEKDESNELITFIHTLFGEKANPFLKVLEGNLNLSESQNITFEKFIKLFSEAAHPFISKQEIHSLHSFQKDLEERVQGLNSLNKEHVSKEQGFDFHPQFQGKEVLFQSLNRDSAGVKTDSGGQAPQVSVQEFASEVMELIKNQTDVKKAADLIEARFSLTPEKLGSIDVKLTIRNGEVQAQFLTETILGKEALESQLSLLKSSLQQQGLQVDKLEVSQSNQNLQNSFSQQEERSRQEQQQSKKKANNDDFYQSLTTMEDVIHRGNETTINILA